MTISPTRARAHSAATKPTPPSPSRVYDVIWRFAAERQRIYLKRVNRVAGPWTDDPILQQYRFTNAYRATDRVSQALIAMVYDTSATASDDTVFLRTLLFKIFNRIDTWEGLVARVGLPEAPTFNVDTYDRALTDLRRHGAIYSAAYIMPSGGAGVPKHRMHLKLLRSMLDDQLPDRIRAAKSLRAVYELLLAYPSFGPFLAFQYTIDLAYTPLVDHPESTFVVPGPGALDGLSKVFTSLGDFTPAEAIMWMTERQHAEFSRLGIAFDDLRGRPLQPIDVQNLLCEVSKYTRVSHPDVQGVAGRSRIKQSYSSAGPLPQPVFPPKWRLAA